MINMSENGGCEIKIINKRKMGKQLRARKISESSEDSEEFEDISSKLEEMKDLQKLRRRPNGISIVGLAVGKVVPGEESNKDPFKIKSGGLLDINCIKNGKIKRVDDAYDTGIGTQFSVETNKRDEDEEMMKYIEEELHKRKRKETTETKTISPIKTEVDSKDQKYFTPEEAALQAVPKHLRESSTQRSEEMLSNQMLSGIPEVDLGIEAKIRNIEATEEAKLKLLWEKHNKKDGPSQFVPSNMAVNFVQHNRFNLDYGDHPKRKHKQVDDKPETSEAKVEDKPKIREKGERATDDYHYEKFRKQFRRF